MNVQTPGARVRITVEGTVRSAQPGEITFTTGTRVTSTANDVHLEVLQPGFAAGDVVTDGTLHYMRVQPRDEPGYWVASDGYTLADTELELAELTLLMGVYKDPAAPESRP